MTTNNLPQTPTSTSLDRTSSWPLGRTRRLERSAERRVQDLAADGYVRANQIAINTQNALASVAGEIEVAEARVHGAAVVQHTETMSLGDYGQSVDALLANAGPVERQLITESVAQATPRVHSVTNNAIRRFNNS